MDRALIKEALEAWHIDRTAKTCYKLNSVGWSEVLQRDFQSWWYFAKVGENITYGK